MRDRYRERKREEERESLTMKETVRKRGRENVIKWGDIGMIGTNIEVATVVVKSVKLLLLLKNGMETLLLLLQPPRLISQLQLCIHDRT